MGGAEVSIKGALEEGVLVDARFDSLSWLARRVSVEGMAMAEGWMTALSWQLSR